ncbi:MAG: hypothetical protein ACYC5G_00690 [Candidatus Doudnabacteria bacterium]
MRSIDEVRKIRRNTAQTIPETQRKTAYKKFVPKRIHFFSFFDTKQITTVAITFVVTFIFSIATSQGLAAINAPKQNQESLTRESPRADKQLAILDQPGVPVFDPNVRLSPDEVYLPKEGMILPDPLKKRKEFLEKYLRAKGTPLADHVDAISEQSQWKLIIAISRAESSFCKHQVTNNCWGIGGAWNMKKYKNYDEAVADVNRILETYYIQSGLDTPKEIVRKYVGHQSDNWELAVEQELENLEEIE